MISLISGIAGICLIMYVIVIAGTWSNFKDLPYYLSGVDGKDIEYLRVRMKFKSWKRLFELNPDRFIFILKNGRKIDPGPLKSSFQEAHPTSFKDEEAKFYVIDFDFWNWLHYWFYCRNILYKLSSNREQEMTEVIVGDLQAKINAIVEESNKHIQQTLNLQQQILDRMGEGKEGPAQLS